jgi:metal-responsive CopG/Arc/MetJ family transcriptional regulator
MAARSVQISIEAALLEEIDRQPETRDLGRSAVIRRALRLYLDVKRRREIDDAYDRAYAGRADEVFDEFCDLFGAQQWPEM